MPLLNSEYPHWTTPCCLIGKLPEACCGRANKKNFVTSPKVCIMADCTILLAGVHRAHHFLQDEWTRATMEQQGGSETPFTLSSTMPQDASRRTGNGWRSSSSEHLCGCRIFKLHEPSKLLPPSSLNADQFMRSMRRNRTLFMSTSFPAEFTIPSS